MPKQRIDKETVITAAFELARENGIEEITVKKIAEKLSCSVQPIYTYCVNMEGLRRDIIAKARNYAKNYVSKKIKKDDISDIFKETGRAYLQLAKEEPNIFKMFILHQRKNVSSLDDLYALEADPEMVEAISRKLNLSTEEAKKLHLNMLIYNIGIGAIFANTAPGIPAEEIFSQQEYAYNAFFNQVSSGNKTAEDKTKLLKKNQQH